MPRTRALVAAVLAVLVLGAPASARSAPDGDGSFDAVAFTAGAPAGTTGPALEAMRALAASEGFRLVEAADGAALVAALPQAEVVAFLNTAGDVLNAAQQTAFEAYIGDGGGFVGTAGAAATEPNWAYYTALVGAKRSGATTVAQQATVEVADHVHPATAPLAYNYESTPENVPAFEVNPRGTVHVLATVDEGSYAPGAASNGFDHPITWCHDFRGGRSFYTGLGSSGAAYGDASMRTQLAGALATAAGAAEAECAATRTGSFRKTLLDDNTLNPLELDITPDNRVVFIERNGPVKVFLPDEGRTVLAGTIEVNLTHEDGLMGLTLDPGYGISNDWIYLFYAPTDARLAADGKPFLNRLSRFEMPGNTLDVASEIIMLEVPTQRQECCHTAGSMQFAPDGNLYLATGDNTNPFQSQTYSPLDERKTPVDRNPFDAQKSSSNTMDLRGKILRIHPEPDGTYTIPPGNLFPPGTAMTRPEIFIMGNRNPYRIGLDAETGWLYWGEVGPDAFVNSPTQGPRGYDEINQARGPGNYGWPYCIGANEAYTEYDFATNTPGLPYDCAGGPENDSPNNTGLARIPPAQPAMIYWPYVNSTEFPENNVNQGVDAGRTAMGGPVYHRPPEGVAAPTAFPAYYEDTNFYMEWSRRFLRTVKLTEDGDLQQIDPFLPEFSYKRPMDMEFGPDGRMYLLEWGSEFFGDNADSGLFMIDYTGDPNAIGPTVAAAANPTTGQIPLEVTYSSAGTAPARPDEPLTYAWDFDRNGTVDSTEPNPSTVFTTPGRFTTLLTVTDPLGNTGTANVVITVNNTAPEVSIQTPVNGGFFAFGDQIPFRLAVNDREEGSTTGGELPCSGLTVQPALGHDTHTHDEGISNVCEGVVQTAADSGHGEFANTFYVVSAAYTDSGGGGSEPLRTRALHVLQPKVKQAEYFSSSQGVVVQRNPASSAPTIGNSVSDRVGGIDSGDFLSYTPVNFLGVDSVAFDIVSSRGPGGSIELRLDGPDGQLVGSAAVPPTAGLPGQPRPTVTFTDATRPVGTHALFLVFRGTGSELFLLDALRVTGPGATVDSGAAAPPANSPEPAPVPTPSPTTPAPPLPATGRGVVRISGQDRIETAARVSASAFPQGAPLAYVATAGDYPDALAGGAAAAAEGAPVLLVGRDDLPAATAAELERLGAERVVVLGGEQAISERVVDALADGRQVERRFGADRFGTAAAVADASFDGAGTVYVATGRGFADALAGGAAAATSRSPVLLTEPGTVPDATAEQLARLAPERIVLLGGEQAVSPAVAGRLAAYGAVERVAGADRFATAALIAARAFPAADDVFVATGGNFPDALAGVPAAARAGAPVLLVALDEVPAATAEQLDRLAPDRVTVLGGTQAVSPRVEQLLAAP